LLFVASGSVVPLAAQLQEDDFPELKREYPGSGPFVCPDPATPDEPSADDRARAGQLASSANQAMILGDLERVEVLLSQASDLDGTSADLAYRRARVLEDLNRSELAMREYCRAIDLNVESLGVTDAEDRIDGLYEQLRARLPVAAQQAFVAGLIAADDTLWTDAIESFSIAVDLAPSWADPLYNRAIIREHIGQLRLALIDYRAYLAVVADPEDQEAIQISQRIGELEGAASVATPNPTGALALGLVPGMGQYYARRPLTGTATLLSAGGAIAAGILIRDISVLCVDDPPAGQPCPPDAIVDEITDRPYLTVGLGIAAAITVAGAIEAFISARRARRAAEELFGPLNAEEPSETGLDIGIPEVSSSGGRLDFTVLRYRFR
jgi:tetratricopeptide (TPR) repeat protein